MKILSLDHFGTFSLGSCLWLWSLVVQVIPCLCIMQVKQHQNKFWTITAVYYQFWRISMHAIGQKACDMTHLHIRTFVTHHYYWLIMKSSMYPTLRCQKTGLTEYRMFCGEILILVHFQKFFFMSHTMNLKIWM